MNKARIKRMLIFLLNPIVLYLKKNIEYLRMKYTKYLDRPIYDKTILFEAYSGQSVTGNSLALFEEIHNDSRFKEYRFIWSSIEPKKERKALSQYRNVKLVKKGTVAYVKYLARAKYLITDTTFPHYFNKREEQSYIMAWHGTPYKTIGKDVKSSNYDSHKNVMKNILHTDYFISPSKYTTDTILNSQTSKDLFSGEVLELGMPRVDLTYNVNAEDLKMKMNIPLEKKVVLYAPTWNDYSQDINQSVSELVRDAEQLQMLLGNDYLVALKVHYYEYQAISNMNTECYLVDNSIDTNKVLQISDYLITDYSSVFFDYLGLKRPIYFYFKNYDEYSTKRGLYLEKDELPGPTCSTIDKLAELISESTGILEDKYFPMIERFSPYDDGKVSKRVIDYIFFNKKQTLGSIYKTETTKEKILIYGGYFKNNGITESLIRLTNQFDYEKYNLTIIIPSIVPKNSGVEKVIDRLDPKINLLFNNNRINLKFNEEYQYKLFMNRGLNGIVKKLNIDHIMYRGYKQIVGNVKYDKVIDFSGYNSFYGSVFAFSNVKEKITYLHSDMKKDKERVVRGRRPNKLPLQLMFSIYKYFDKILSVSKTSHLTNLSKLGEQLGITNKMDYVENYLDAERIERLSEEYQEFNILNQKVLIDNVNLEDGVLEFKGILKPSKNNNNYVTLGRLSPEKNQELLIRAFKRVLNEEPNSRLYIIGEGTQRKKLMTLIQNLEIEDKVILTGHMDNPYYLLKMCDVFVLSSNYEGQALAILEALAVGLKVISTDIPGPDNILKQGYGELVEATEIGLSRKMISVIKPEKKYKKFDPYLYDEKVKERVKSILE
ncbi:glycosyltransferase [Amphibacillus xylanus]|uniref:Putative teichoic acid biosynthesis protein n=1 Tax=Amphibacillus xylanus (strain ATCC 51415 / DSM 6626 / JCM 7361 / LMG 17667 / NBRC 15112 / Ep01) TaxID=698758 RepID=K0J7Y1_AMPXN|nr:glycosyltransferase [Amphibacillus xylanus]BAM48158.1 putative teichoic acid biosynthesis protein [Amphibacillus xylanus NBRC 15112]